MKVIKKCRSCGDEFASKPSKVGSFCGMACYRAFQRSGEYKIHKSRKWFNNCHVCGTFVGKPPARDRNGNVCDKVFCSMSCYLKHHDRNNNIEVVQCAGCGKDVEATKKRAEQEHVFCSTECRRSIDRSSVCKSCGVHFTAVQIRRVKGGTYNVVRVPRQTCSPGCLSEFYRTDKDRKDKISEAFSGDKHPNWQGGSHVLGNRGAGWGKISEKVREKAQRICECCGLTEAEHGRKLEVHHKVPYHQFLNKKAANKLSNLEALCKSCHTKKDWEYRRSNPMQMPLNWSKRLVVAPKNKVAA